MGRLIIIQKLLLLLLQLYSNIYIIPLRRDGLLLTLAAENWLDCTQAERRTQAGREPDRIDRPQPFRPWAARHAAERAGRAKEKPSEEGGLCVILLLVRLESRRSSTLPKGR